MKKKLIIILGVLVVLYLIGKGCSSTSSPTNSNQTPTTTANNTVRRSTQPETNQPPTTVFDARLTIPGTAAIVSYPAKGFYGKGAIVKTFQPGDPNQYGHVLSIQPEQTYDKKRNAEFVTLVVSLVDPTADEKTLEGVVANLGNTSLDADAIKDNGHYQTFNDQKFFVYKIDDAMVVWQGATLYQNHILNFTMMYNPAGDLDAKTYSTLNDQLFADILQHISYK